MLEQRVRRLEDMMRELRQNRQQQSKRRLSFRPGNLLRHLEAAAEDIEEIQRKAQARGDYRLVLACIREKARIVELVARLRGELESRAPQNNFVNFNFDPETSRKMLETYIARRKTLEGDHDRD